MIKPIITIIIPTHNRTEILTKTLKALENQTIDKNKFEIIIVDDGSTDKTKKTVIDFQTKRSLALEYIHQNNQGQGNARNKGLTEAKGEIIVFIGDDIIVNENFLEEHLKTHKKHPQKNSACLGFIEWHPELKITSFMKWLTNGSCILGKYGGHQFAFEKLKDKKEADYNFFYTSNISLKKTLFENNKFDPNFSKYGWEDIELGYRLTLKENLKIHYNPKAIALHYHEINQKSLAPRMKMIAKSAYIIDQKYPELHKIPSPKKRFIFQLISNPIALFLFKLASIIIPTNKTKAYYFYALSKKYYLEGLKK